MTEIAKTMNMKLPVIRPLLYTDTIGGSQIGRDDMWVLTTEELNAIDSRIALLETVAEIAEKRPNKMGPHFMIWMDAMDAACTAARGK